MQTLRLPPRLLSEPELLKLNRLLSARAIRLDWSDVQADQVTSDQLDILFRGLTLDVHIEYIDACENTTDTTTISEALSPLIEAAFLRAENDIDATISRPVRTKSQALPPPALWSPPSSYEPESEAEQTTIRKNQPSIKILQDDAVWTPTELLANDKLNDTLNRDGSLSEFTPIYEIPSNETAADISALVDSSLDMFELSYAEMAHLPTLLQPLVHAYIAWVEEQMPYSDQANLHQYRATLRRIQQSIHLLSTDQQASRAFAFMNQVMGLACIHTLWVQEKRNYKLRTLNDIYQQSSNRSWSLFQLAFVLLNIPALIDVSYVDRNATKGALADLRWFPTGEWKAEAYLGLAAYTLGIRRLQDGMRNSVDRVTAILRYATCTLTQQFQHAAALICACETVRRADRSTWGATPFRLGLHIGPHASMHTTGARREVMKRTDDNREMSSCKNMSSLTYCPWCGSNLEYIQSAGIASQRGRTLIYCRDPKNECAFGRTKAEGEGLPILVAAEKVHLKPALLITAEA